jgi:prevent-host-death family protein
VTSHSYIPPRIWPVQDAKARFSEMLEAAVRDGPQIVTKRGVETAVLVPIEEWQQLADRSKAEENRPTLKDLLLAKEPRFDLESPPRGSYRHRPPPSFDD